MQEKAPRFAPFAGPVLKAAGIELRHAGEADMPFLAAVYATTRDEELRQVDWDAARKKVFTDWQSSQQEFHYAQHYPNAERLVICGEGCDIGRIYVDTTQGEVRLMEVTLLPAHRNQGIGTRLMEELMRYADEMKKPLTLHVEPFNPARRMYTRMGFVAMETRGLYELMERPAPS